MKLSDIVALAKSGYKVSEIKELLELGNETPEENTKVVNNSGKVPDSNTSQPGGGASESDIVALAKRGYKVSEIKELLELGNETPEENTKVVNNSGKVPDSNTSQPGGGASESKAEAGNTNKEDTTDYKTLYENLLEENRKRTLHNDISGGAKEKTTQEVINEAFRNLIS